MYAFHVNSELCRKDGICAKVCPMRILDGPVGSVPVIKSNGVGRCIGCGQCIAFCPHNAASVEGLPAEHGVPIEKKEVPTPEQVGLLLKGRRSIRVYKDKPVPVETLEAIFDIARYAPTAVNKQPVRWVVFHDKEQFKLLGDLTAEALLFFAKNTPKDPFSPMARALAASWDRGQDYIFRGAPHLACAVTPNTEVLAWARVDASIALTYLEVAAASYGVGACWGGYFTKMVACYEPLRQTLGMSKEEIMPGAQMLGFPQLAPKAIPPRPAARIDWR